MLLQILFVIFANHNIPRKLQQTMKRIILAIIILTTALTAQAQATQPCVVKQYNQKQQKTPLGGVQVTVGNAGSAASAADGRLTLTFRTLKPGDRVNLISAKKPGFEVFNKHAVEQWTVSRGAAFELVLVRSDYFAQLKSRLTQTSTDSYKVKYEQAMQELEQQKKAGKLKEAEYNQKLDELESSYQTQLSNLDNYIDQFARIDMSMVSEEEQRILDMVQDGRVDEAVKAYDDMDVMGKLRQVREEKRVLSEAKAKIEEEEARQDQVIEDLKELLDNQIATLKLAGGKDNYDKIARILKENALADTTDIDAVWDYADFAYDQNDFKDAERFYLICLSGSKDDLYQQADFQNNLGLVYSELNDYAKAEEYLLEALENYTQLFAQDSDYYRDDLAMIQDCLGSLYNDLHDNAKAEEYKLKALENYTQLLAQNSDYSRDDLVRAQNKLGRLYDTEYDEEKALEYYLKALENCTYLFSQNPDAYREDLANTQHHLGSLYNDLDDNAKAEEYYLKALENRTQLFSQNPDAYRAELANTQHHLGYLYRDLHDNAKAEEYYLKALENYDILFSKIPEAYRDDLALIQKNLGSLYSANGDNAKAEEYYFKALENYELLFSLNPDIYHEDIASTQRKMGDMYSDAQDYVKAEEYYLKSLENYDYLLGRNPKEYHVQYSLTLEMLVDLYLTTDNQAKAEQYYIIGLETYKRLFEEDPEYYHDDLAETMKEFGDYYISQQNYEKAEECYLGILETLKHLFKEDPDYYREDMAEKQKEIGDFYCSIKNNEKAENFYLMALENFTIDFKEFPNLYRSRLAGMQQHLGDFYSGVENYSKAEDYYLKALENYSIEKEEDSLEIILQMANIQLCLGELYHNTDNNDKSEEYYFKALENYTVLFKEQPNRYRTYLVLAQEKIGELYDNINDNTKAEEYYLKALENYTLLFEANSKYRKDLAEIQLNLAFLYSDDSRLDQYDAMLSASLAHYEVLCQEDSSLQSMMADLLLLKGWNLLQQKKTDEALTFFERAYQLGSEEPTSILTSCYNTKAYEYAEAKDFFKAIETIDRAIALMPEEANYYDSKGEILLMKGDEQEALKMWQKVMELDPDFLSRYNGETELHRQLKEKGLIND